MSWPANKSVIASAVPVRDLMNHLSTAGFSHVRHTGITGVKTPDTTVGATFTAIKKSP
jgi:hypothetical protein